MALSFMITWLKEKHMSEYKLKRHAVKLWANPYAPRSTVRHNRRAWLRSVLRLGDKWLLAQPIRRVL